MRKILLVLLLFVFLAACGAQETVETVDEPLVEDSDPPPATESESESDAQPVSADAITPAETAAEAGIMRDRDWTKGADDPLITIIEYGDFQ